MKKMNAKCMTARVLTALVVAVSVVMGLGACSEKDNPTLFTTVQEQLTATGFWYAEADWSGTIEDESMPFTRVVQLYYFGENGSGQWQKLYVTAGYDILRMRSNSIRYSVSANGTVAIQLDEEDEEAAEWNMKWEDGRLVLATNTPDISFTSGDDSNEPMMTFSPATDSQVRFARGFLSEDASFLTDWEHCESVSVNGLEYPVATPWNSESQSAIPYSVSKQCRRSQGWEMAFCSLNNTATPDIRYFGLYNKWTGTLRVFHYIVNPTGYGNEIDYQVWMGRDQMMANEAPFYNAMEYGIPANHQPRKSIAPDVQLFGSSRQTQPFMTWVSPYRIYEQALISGWYCFDLDMSGYVPDGQQWRDVQDDVKLMIVPQFRNNQNITLMGSLIGDIGGTQSPERIIQTGGGNMFSGVCGVLDMISGKASSSISGCNTYASLMKTDQGAMGQFLNPIKYWGGFGCSMASTALNMLGTVLAEPETYDTIPGKIDLKMDAQLDLAGTISNFVSSPQPIYRVTLANIDRTNGPGGHFGRGVWSLADDPVVYVDTEDIMGDDGTGYLNPFEWGPYTYFNLDNYKNCKFRLVWFLDPNSVKVNINRDLFPDAQHVTVNALCGIYPKRNMGYTDNYRKLMMLEDRPTYPISKNSNRSITTSTDNPRLVKVTADALLDYADADNYETRSNSSTVELAGWEHHAVTVEDARTHKPVETVRLSMSAYGRVIKELDKTIMVTPQLFVPNNNAYFMDPVIPDLVVSVDVTFEACGSTFHYTKCFVPKIKLIGRAETLSRYQGMLEFADKSRQQQPTGSLANDGTVPVYSPDAYKMMGKTLHMLSLIK